MDRETQTLTTPLGKELTLKTYLTAKERNGYVETAEKELKAGGIDSDSSTAQLRIAPKLLTLVAVSYDGSGEDIPGRLDDQPSVEFDFALKEVAKVAKGNFPEAK